MEKKSAIRISTDLTFNHGIQLLGYSLLVKYWEVLYSLTDVIVSVGSGLGTVEHKLEQEMKQLKQTVSSKLLCVDPNPDSFQRKTSSTAEKAPDFKTVSDLLEKKSELKQNCGLFLNWPLPSESMFGFQVNKLPYDLEAILALQPRAILLVCESTGSSGSQQLLKWLRHYVKNWQVCKADVLSSAMEERVTLPPDLSKGDYVVSEETKRVVVKGGFIGTLVYRYVLLLRKDVAQKYQEGGKKDSLKQYESDLCSESEKEDSSLDFLAQLASLLNMKKDTV